MEQMEMKDEFDIIYLDKLLRNIIIDDTRFKFSTIDGYINELFYYWITRRK